MTTTTAPSAITFEPTFVGFYAYPTSGWEPGEPIGHGKTEAEAMADLTEHRDLADVEMPFVCKCGQTRFATAAEQYQMQPNGAFKCPTCHTFSTDHRFRGDESTDWRCYDCDTRSWSHR